MPPTRARKAFAVLFALLMVTSVGVTTVALGAGTVEAQTSQDVQYRVNAGGSTVMAVDGGPDWTPPGSTSGVSVSGSDQSYDTGDSITLDGSAPSGTPADVFQTERYGDQQPGSATVELTPDTGTEASTYTGGSFTVENTGEQQIRR
ncbi:hypothetical protein B4589_000490 [Halolamina sp. CBA1230]|uniref:hypothetical protein n=1 Tax=Halolamina sp. CBA1230 TaxID=1853690 RepID=UPI00117B51C4|nr:hypothetical protein [Halolamina sp. CBA1230]QKY18920.1 hypothetical protein B4589_000490 [Halolamina sp. CBA1230]